VKPSFLVLALFLIAVSFFHFHPAVESGRIVIPEDVYSGTQCDCQCILNSRPWYSQFNYWFWLWVIGTPVIIFSVKPSAPTWQKSLRTIIAIVFCYGVMNLALHLMWDIRNGPFVVHTDPNFPWQKTWDMAGCANIADGASLIFTLMFGWIYAIIYTGWCEIAWLQYYKRKTLSISQDFKRDIISRVFATISYAVAKIAFLTLIALPFAIGILFLLEKL
jgi:hypothetical protein